MSGLAVRDMHGYAGLLDTLLIVNHLKNTFFTEVMKILGMTLHTSFVKRRIKEETDYVVGPRRFELRTFAM